MACALVHLIFLISIGATPASNAQTQNSSTKAQKLVRFVLLGLSIPHNQQPARKCNATRIKFIAVWMESVYVRIQPYNIFWMMALATSARRVSTDKIITAFLARMAECTTTLNRCVYAMRLKASTGIQRIAKSASTPNIGIMGGLPVCPALSSKFTTSIRRNVNIAQVKCLFSMGCIVRNVQAGNTIIKLLILVRNAQLIRFMIQKRKSVFALLSAPLTVLLDVFLAICPTTLTRVPGNANLALKTRYIICMKANAFNALPIARSSTAGNARHALITPILMKVLESVRNVQVTDPSTNKPMSASARHLLHFSTT